MKSYCLFHNNGCGFRGAVKEPIKNIIFRMKDGMCLWVCGDDFYMEVDCPDSKSMNARFETGEIIINKLFPYTFDGFVEACEWFDKRRQEYGR